MLPLVLALLAAGDGEILGRLQKRDPHALEQLYDRYGRMVYGLILRIVADRGVAEDLVQETFLRVWNRAAGFDAERGAAGPWLLAVARNRAIDYLRSRDRRDRNTLELNESEHPSLFADLQSEVLKADIVKRVRQALERLGPKQRQAMELAYFEGLSQSEIAERLSEPLGTVKTWMRRTLQQMREELGSTASL